MQTIRKERLRVSELLPDQEEKSRSSVTLPKSVWEALQEVADVETKERKAQGKDGFSRDEVIAHFCKWALQEWQSERAASRKARK